MPSIDPKTGKPIENPDANPNPGDGGDGDFKISKEDWQGLQTKLDVFDKIGAHLGNPPPAPAAPAAPAGPTLADQVKEIDTDIAKIGTQIDEALSAQKPVSELLSKRDTLTAKRTRLQIQHEDLAPIQNVGMTTLNQLSDRVTRSEMPYYDIVKDEYNRILSSIPADQQALPEARKMAYDTAVGRNSDKIIEAEREKILREAANINAPDATASQRGKDKDGNEIPEPVDLLGSGAMQALKEKGQTVDDYYRSMGRGYTGYEDWYNKVGKKYYGEES